jgi:hypothetical protein
MRSRDHIAGPDAMTMPSLSLDRVAPAWLGKWLRDNLANRRLRFLLVALGFTLAAGGATLLDAADASMQRTLAERQQQLARIEHLGETGLWHQRRAESELSRAQTEARLWEAETDGLAQANFQSWVLDQAARAGLGSVEIHTSINPTANNSLKLRQLTAQVTGRFDAAALFKLAQAIAGHDHLLVVNRLEIQTAPISRFEMVLGTFLRPGPPQRSG